VDGLVGVSGGYVSLDKCKFVIGICTSEVIRNGTSNVFYQECRFHVMV
jgi:hypothetical protein